MDKYTKKGLQLLRRIYKLENRIPEMNKDTILKDVIIIKSKLQDIRMEFMSEVSKFSKNSMDDYKDTVVSDMDDIIRELKNKAGEVTSRPVGPTGPKNKYNMTEFDALKNEFLST
jgi:hypothetical protein